MRINDIRTNVGCRYFRYWTNALVTILGWPSEKVETWTERFRTEINDEDAFLFHYHPGVYLVPLLMPPDIEQAAAKRGLQVEARREIADAVNHNFFPELWDGNGWIQAKVRVENVLQKLRKDFGLVEP